jgi:hypothetical protein
MDPYLEGEFWQEFHETLAGAIRAQLMPLLSPKYVALLAKRYVIDQSALGLFDLPTRVVYPDVHVLQHGPEPAAPSAVSTTLTPADVEVPNGIEVPQLSVEIRDVAQRRLVTVIEILSPANKYGEGAYEYTQRRAELLRTWTNLLEIDLLRGGKRVVLGGPVPPASYYVYLTRAVTREAASVWTIQLADRLPTVPVPLSRPDPDVPLNLQAAVDACFALVGYERLLDYAAPPPPPELAPAEQAWVEGRVREHEGEG